MKIISTRHTGLAVLLILGILTSCGVHKSNTSIPSSFSKDNLIPWSIVSFDIMERTPTERVQMVKDLGYNQYAFGGKMKHVKTLPQELEIAKTQGVNVSAVWIYLNKDEPNKLSIKNESVFEAVQSAGLKSQFWVGFSPKYFEGLDDDESMAKALSISDYLARRAEDIGCQLALYNHGGWFGNPDRQLDVIHQLTQRKIGMVYNFHHGHEDIDRYETLFPRLMPYLLCVNLNGMEKDGKKIMTIGSGDYERAMVSELQNLGYNGPWGILGHVKGGDAKEVLQQNHEGLMNLDKPKRQSEKQAKKRVFLFAGQSNMDGRADAALMQKEDITRLGNIQNRIDFRYNHRDPQPLDVVTPANHTQRKFNLEQSFGPELFFGINLAESNPQDSFLFIKRAQGGTSLHGCWNPYWSLEKATLMDEQDKTKLFADFIDYTRSILKDIDPQEYKLEGLLWVQGESDSGKKRGPIPSEMYYTNLKNLLAETRKELNMPSLPMYIFQVGQGKVVEGMKRLAAEDPNVYFIPQSKKKESEDFYEKNPPPIGHYTAKSMKKIGRAFFEKYNESHSID